MHEDHSDHEHGNHIHENIAVSELIQRLKDKNSGIRYKAVKALIFYGEQSVAPLIEALKDQDSSVRENAAWCLGKIGDKALEGLSSLEKLTKDPDKYVREKSQMAINLILENARR